MKAIQYEHLLRRIYKCGRGGVDGANADFYRKLEQAEREYKSVIDKTPIQFPVNFDDVEYEYQKQCGLIWFYVSSAITKAKDECSHIFSESDLEELNNFKLGPGSQIYKHEIDNVIDKVEALLIKYKIFPN